MITNVDDYFTKGCGRCSRFDTPECSATIWHKGLLTLRQICLEVGLNETVKWGQPCYTYADRNIVMLGAFRGNYRLGFFNPGMMRDPENMMQNQGPNSKHKNALFFTETDQPAAMADTIRAYLREAMGYADQGLVQPKVETEIALPDGMCEAMDTDPELAEAFHALTKGRQKSYAFALASAKKSQTRVNRITKLRAKILSGKGANEY